MAETAIAAARAALAGRRWTSVAGAWMGVGTGPGALLMGAGLAARHGWAVPVISVFLGLLLLSAIVWVQGQLGLLPPLGEGANLTQVGQRYLTPSMRRILGALIGIGMTGWFGVNVGMGASALVALGSPLGLQRWVATLLLGVPIALVALQGMQGWNRLATVTTACVLALVGLVTWRYRAGPLPVTLGSNLPDAATDVAVLVGYVGVFSLRAPDFTTGMSSRRDLTAVTLLLSLPMVIVIFAGAVLAQRAGSSDLIAVLAAPGGIAIGNILIALAVVAPTFTTFYSGAPGLRAAIGIGEKPAMVLMAVVGLGLAAVHFDELLLPWLGVLGAVLPPIIVPLAVEFYIRRRGRAPRLVPVWPWLAGAGLAAILALAHSPVAMLAGFLAIGAATAMWRSQRMPARAPILSEQPGSTFVMNGANHWHLIESALDCWDAGSSHTRTYAASSSFQTRFVSPRYATVAATAPATCESTSAPMRPRRRTD